MGLGGWQTRALVFVLCAAWAGAGDALAAPAKTGPAAAAAPKPRLADSKAPAKTAGRPSSKPSSSKGPSKPVRAPDDASRRLVAGGPTADDVGAGAESAELRALHEAERELFPPAAPAVGAPWPNDLPFPLTAPEDAPHVHASGLPPAPVPTTPPLAEGGHDLSWLSRLDLPNDLPIRWEARVVRYLEFFKNDPRGRRLFSYWLKRSGRYRDAIRQTLRRKSLPDDLLWIAMIESGFDPAARSPAGAVGLWQFMADTGRLYGLSVDRWLDQRMSVPAATEAAADFFSDLYRRFGSWDLAIAAYNMGYAGVVAVERRYNTNDFWTLTRLEGALPWETTLYVPKLMAVAIVAHNLSAFGYADVPVDPAIDVEEVRVPPGTALSAVASAAGCTSDEIRALNLELRAGRTPPAPPPDPASPADASDASYPVKVPAGKALVASQNLAKAHPNGPPLERYVVRFGESLEQIAAARKVPVARLAELNAVAQGEVIRGGTVILVPVARGGTASAPGGSDGAAKPVVIVPADVFAYPDRRRVFYRVGVGDTLPGVASSFHVTVDELRRWNGLDPAARLQEGMTLQAFVPPEGDLSHVNALAENDVRIVPVGSDDFFAYWEGAKGKKRITVTAKAGETLETLARRYGVTAPLLERINHRPRNEHLQEGDTVVVYLPPPLGKGSAAGRASAAGTAAVADSGSASDAPTGASLPDPSMSSTALPPLPPIDSLPELP